MTKNEALKYIRTLAQNRVISRDEIISAYDEGRGVKGGAVPVKKAGVSEVLYYVGGAIVFLGIVILLNQNWTTLNIFTKVLVTLGAGIAAYIVGLLFGREEKTETVGSAFYLISALVMPLGLYVIFDNAGIDAQSSSSQSLISGILFITYLLSYVVFRKNVFTLFSIFFATWFFYSFTSFMVAGNPLFNDQWKFYEYRTLASGLAYILLGYAFSKNKHASLSGFLYGFGILGFLAAALSLGGWKPEQNVFWELIYPALIFATLFLSVHMKSKSFLTFGAIFLVTYVFKITAEYFTDGLGWPLVLVIVGLAIIGIGYLAFSLKKKYMS